MATYTAKSVVVGTIGASGANGFTAIITAQNTAVATAVTTAMAVTGAAAQSVVISPAQLVVDTNSALFEIIQTITYTVVS